MPLKELCPMHFNSKNGKIKSSRMNDASLLCVFLIRFTAIFSIVLSSLSVGEREYRVCSTLEKNNLVNGFAKKLTWQKQLVEVQNLDSYKH